VKAGSDSSRDYQVIGTFGPSTLSDEELGVLFAAHGIDWRDGEGGLVHQLEIRRDHVEKAKRLIRESQLRDKIYLY
jgi:hypothetical protein